MEFLKPMLFDIKIEEEKAKNGNGLSCYIVGRSYDSAENGVEQDLSKAVFWYGKGTEINDPRCIYGLGACYYFGDGVEQDLNKAHELFVDAYPKLVALMEQEKDFPKKQAFTIFCIGAYYYFGFGDIVQDENMAFKLINQSAMMGHIAGIYDLGANFYHNGVGTNIDEEKSKYYLKIASDYGLPRAKKKIKEYGYDMDSYSR